MKIAGFHWFFVEVFDKFASFGGLRSPNPQQKANCTYFLILDKCSLKIRVKFPNPLEKIAKSSLKIEAFPLKNGFHNPLAFANSDLQKGSGPLAQISKKLNFQPHAPEKFLLELLEYDHSLFSECDATFKYVYLLIHWISNWKLRLLVNEYVLLNLKFVHLYILFEFLFILQIGLSKLARKIIFFMKDISHPIIDSCSCIKLTRAFQ